ncbi:hypothetical protein BG74_00570 [Sodalis-like endosymbiont of Proechinophthirus fluctus]|nr:hypothetical protein BG74_00570 [Sodalis-like endosymbiont of Proechinophthirus fluctus]
MCDGAVSVGKHNTDFLILSELGVAVNQWSVLGRYHMGIVAWLFGEAVLLRCDMLAMLLIWYKYRWSPPLTTS